MTASERQQEILCVLVKRRQAKTEDLAAILGVTERTIRSDVTTLSLKYPIETVKGRYGGGIRLAGWFRPDRKVLAQEQIDAIRKAAPFLQGEDRQALLSILAQFTSL